MQPQRPEILAPVGDWEMCRAAVHNGADAVYFGMPGFNARGRAVTLSKETIKEMIDFCRLHGVKTFMACNVLIFEREIEAVAALLRDVLALAPDALIVQDIGLVRLIKFLAPEQEVHASTQMTITSYEAIEATKDLGMSRYILGREVSIPEMQKIREKTDKELEVFVHGALCVSYSGQCLTSERIGGRSANRGQCAQSCRLEYDLIVDGEKREMGEKRYLVSPKDLCALADVPRIAAAGINSLKIEGRLKSPEYVASTVSAYRQALDHPDQATPDSGDLAVIYSRDFFNGWMDGVNHQRLVRADYSSHHGLELGTVKEVRPGSVIVSSARALAPGDGVVFADFSRAEVAAREIGGNIYKALQLRDKKSWELAFSRTFNLRRILPGMKVFLNSRPSLEKTWRMSFSDKTKLKKIPLRAVLSGKIGERLTLELHDPENRIATAVSDGQLLAAESAPLSEEFLHEAIGALGGTSYMLEELECRIEGKSFIHQREIKKLRQEACRALDELRTTRPLRTIKEPSAVAEWIGATSHASVPTTAADPSGSLLNVLIRESEQLAALKGLAVDTVYLDFEFGKDYTDALQEVRELGFRAGIATTRIHKPGENGHLTQIRRLKPDTILVRNLGALHFLRGCDSELVGDFSLNVANSLSASWFFARGLQRLCPSYDLNYEQLLELLAHSASNRFEITVHQYMPSFHMEHCVFAAFLSNGSSYRDCGRPCEKHRVALRDRTGAIQPLKADAECRNTMFSGVPQSAARLVPTLRERGVGVFRLEALYETVEELRAKVQVYSDLLSGSAHTDEVYERLGITEKYGVSEGQLFSINTYKDRKKAANER